MQVLSTSSFLEPESETYDGKEVIFCRRRSVEVVYSTEGRLLGALGGIDQSRLLLRIYVSYDKKAKIAGRLQPSNHPASTNRVVRIASEGTVRNRLTSHVFSAPFFYFPKKRVVVVRHI